MCSKAYAVTSLGSGDIVNYPPSKPQSQKADFVFENS